jgi:hypothetical protein
MHNLLVFAIVPNAVASPNCKILILENARFSTNMFGWLQKTTCE